jgi:hypothetical protein
VSHSWAHRWAALSVCVCRFVPRPALFGVVWAAGCVSCSPFHWELLLGEVLAGAVSVGCASTLTLVGRGG